MLEQLGFHDFERNILADQVLERYATRIGGQFNERQAAAFRPWSWMEKNRKRLVVCLPHTDSKFYLSVLLTRPYFIRYQNQVRITQMTWS